MNIVNSFPKTKNVLVWVSLPCTGGTSWSYVNMKIPSAAQKVIAHVVLFKRLWKAMKSFLNAIERDHYIAIEWPKVWTGQRLQVLEVSFRCQIH